MGVKGDRAVVSFPRVKDIDAEYIMNGMMEDTEDLMKRSCRKESQRNLHSKVQKKKYSNHKLLETKETECLKGRSPICLALLREMKLFM